MKVSARYALLTLFQSIGELPTGGADVRRSTFRKNANCYEAEAPTFRLWVVSHIIDLESGDVKQKVEGFIAAPDWSPDGQHIVYGDRGDIYIMGSNFRNRNTASLAPSR